MIDSSALHDPESGEKLGFGSSAAVAVSLAAACKGTMGSADPVDDAGARAHRRFQGDRGSGVDVATAMTGGVIQFVKGAAPERLDWPAGLQYRVYWSGIPASTRAKIAQAPDTTAGNLRASADEVAGAWGRGDPEEILGRLADFADALEAFDAATGIGVFAAGHAEMRAAGRTVPGLVYKPCGAGGGDVGIAIAQHDEALGKFDVLASEYGYVALDARMDPQGVRVTPDVT